MLKVHIRDDIPPQQIGTNGCTPPIRIHPKNGCCWIFERREVGFDKKCGKFRKVKDDHASLIFLDGRQWWTCYYYDVGDHGWNCERNNVILRLSESDFIQAFGNITVIDSKYGRYHVEAEEATLWTT